MHDEQAKLLRVLQLIRLLHQPPAKTLAQLTERLGVNERTVRRYLDLLREIGYFIDSGKDKTLFISEEKLRFSNYKFSVSEANLIKQAIRQLHPNHALQQALLNKIDTQTDLIPLADSLLNTHLARITSNLEYAIKWRQVVVLRQYHSANSAKVSDRMVEPLSLTENMQQLNAYERESRTQKTYRLDRIGDVELLPQEKWTFKGEEKKTDVFGWQGDKPIAVRLRLRDLAYRVLREERPLALPMLYQDPQDGAYYFEGVVYGYTGIGRFVLSLPGEIDIISDEGLRQHVRERIGKFRV